MDNTASYLPASGRRRAGRLAAVAATALALVAVLLPAQAASASASDEDHFATRVNQERAANGLPALTQVADLQEIARRHAETMAAQNKLFHNPSLATQVTSWSRLAENVGYGGGAETVHLALMASPGHKANILDRGVSQMGIGVVWSGNRLWVTQVFRQPTGAAAALPPVTTAPAPAPIPAFQPPAACVGAPGTSFADVPRSAWYVGAVDCAVNKTLTLGLTATTYGPERSVTRAQMASFVHRLLLRGDATSAQATATAAAADLFRDDAGSPHELAINTLAHLGVLNGTGPGTYGPQLQVTRGQMASMLVRLQEEMHGPMATKGTPFTDIAGSPHAVNIDKVFSAGITSGTSATTFTPNAGVRRDGMSVFLVRTFGGLSNVGAVK